MTAFAGIHASNHFVIPIKFTVVLAVLLCAQSSLAFSSGIIRGFRTNSPQIPFLANTNERFSASTLSATEDGDDGVSKPPKLTGALSDTKLHEFELREHKPLGCSIEESLATEADGAKYVFVAQVNEGSHAQKAGIEVGDVIVQTSGTFNEVLDVAGLGIEKIRSLVAGRPKDEPLVIRVARGSDVLQRHEMALVELCILGDDIATSNCITSIYQYEDDFELAGDGEMAACEEDDAECLLDSMWDTWSEGLPVKSVEEESEEEVKEEKKKVAPWSSRSSPSGTYVRDPVTGKMRNIDED